MRPRPSRPPRSPHHFGGVRPPSMVRLVLFLLVVIGAMWVLLRTAG